MEEEAEDIDVRKFATDEHVLSVRAKIRERCVEVLRDAKLKSLLLSVGQYWSDNADDEVHLFLSGSKTADFPEWPHDCSYWDDREPTDEVCTYCDETIARTYDWGYLELIPAFEAFCYENANQDMSTAQSHRPFLLFRDDGSVTQVGALVRPWSDGWRSKPPEIAPLSDRILSLCRRDAIEVLGDALEESLPDDPRTRTILAARAGLPIDPNDARAWVHHIDVRVPRTGVHLVDGVPDEIEIHIDYGSLTYIDRDPLPWAFHPRLRFLPGGQIGNFPGLEMCRAIGPIDGGMLEAIARSTTIFPFLEELEARDVTLAQLGLLPSDRLPKLSTLILINQTIACLPKLPRTLARLELVAYREPDEYVKEIVAWRRANLPFPVTIAMHDGAGQRAAGFAVTIDKGVTTIERRGYHVEATPALLAQLSSC